MEYDLSRFILAQQSHYQTALKEIRSGHKESHWIWYVFPQLRGLGRSEISDYYGIADLSEAKAYLRNNELRRHLIEITAALLQSEQADIRAVMGYPDDLKLRSSMTLFALADPDIPSFRQVLDRYFNGEMDDRTIQLLNLR